jgi:hypothetical protein
MYPDPTPGGPKYSDRIGKPVLWIRICINFALLDPGIRSGTGNADLDLDPAARKLTKINK